MRPRSPSVDDELRVVACPDCGDATVLLHLPIHLVYVYARHRKGCVENAHECDEREAAAASLMPGCCSGATFRTVGTLPMVMERVDEEAEALVRELCARRQART